MLASSSIRDFFKSSTTRFAHDRAGGVAVIMGLLLIPLVGAVGLAVDSARAYSVKMRLQESIDAAALVGGRNYTDSDRDAQIESYFLANWKSGFQGTGDPPTLANGRLTITTNPNTHEVTVSANVTMPTMIVQVLPGAPNQVLVSNHGSAVKGDTMLEVALALDNTTSMTLRVDGTFPNNDSERRLEDMKTAAKNFVNLLYTDDKGNVKQTVSNMWVSLIPFTSMVNIGNKNTSFIVPNMINKIQWDYPKAKGNNFGNDNDTWRGCVFERSWYEHDSAPWSSGPHPSDAGYSGRDLTDDPPSVEAFMPYYVPPMALESTRPCNNVCKRVVTPTVDPTAPTTPTTPTTPPACYKYFDGYSIPCSFNPKNLKQKRETVMSIAFKPSGEPSSLMQSRTKDFKGFFSLAAAGVFTPTPVLRFGPTYPFTFNGISYTQPTFYSDWTEYCLIGDNTVNDWRTSAGICAKGFSHWCNYDVKYYTSFKRKLSGAIPLYGPSADPSGPSTVSLGYLADDPTFGTLQKDFCEMGNVQGNSYTGWSQYNYMGLWVETTYGRWITPVVKKGKTVLGGWGNSGCGLPLIPLQEKRQTLLDKIDDMEVPDLPPSTPLTSPHGAAAPRPDNGYSGTLINQGLVWAWRTLSPKWRGLWKDEKGNTVDSTLPLDPGEGRSKAIVIMTDGLNFLPDYDFGGGALRQASIIDRKNNGDPTTYTDLGNWTQIGVILEKSDNPVLMPSAGFTGYDPHLGQPYGFSATDSSAYGILGGYPGNYQLCMRVAQTPTAAPYGFDGYEDANTCRIYKAHMLRSTAHAAAPFAGGYPAFGVAGNNLSASPTNANTGTYYDELEYRLGKTCKNIRDQGIRIYFVLFAVNNTHPMKTRAINSFNDCVSGMGKVYDAVDTVQLNAAFKDIAASIRQLRLSQ